MWLAKLENHKDIVVHNFILPIIIALLLAGNFVYAGCAKLPDEIKGDDQVESSIADIVWENNNRSVEYEPTVQWISDGQAASQFQVIVVDGNGKEVSWPYPLGQGLFLGVTTDPTISIVATEGSDDEGQVVGSYSMDLNLPTDPLPSFSVQKPITSGKFSFVGRFYAFIYTTTGSFEDGPLNPPPTDLYLAVKPVQGSPGQVSRARGNWDFICTTDSMKITTSCSLHVEPTSIFFDDMQASGTQGTLEQVKQSQVQISCDSGGVKEVNLRLFPAKPPVDGSNRASFVHVDSGSDFNGLGLIYKINSRPTNCDDGCDPWQQSVLLGDPRESNPVIGTIYWGLCRTAPIADTGSYTTTAVIRLWVD